MYQLSFLTFLILLFSPLSFMRLDAAERRVLHIEDRTFLIKAPADWELVEPADPFDYRFVHKSGTRECRLLLNCYDSKIDSDDLLVQLFVPLEDLYGDRFFDSPNYSHLYFNQGDSSDFIMWSFYWKKGDVVETVTAFAFQENGYCSRTMVFISQNQDNNLDYIKEDFALFLNAVQQTK